MREFSEYDFLDSAFNRAVVHLASTCWRDGFDVANRAPGTMADLHQHVSLTGRMLVWAGASDRTIYGDATVNHAMRAWHDYHHLAGQHDFSLAGEFAACARQIAHLRHAMPQAPSLWSRLIWLEVIGQSLYADATGHFITDQVAWTLAQLGKE